MQAHEKIEGGCREEGDPALAACLAMTVLAHAQQAWPTRTVKLIVPNQPGSGADIAARLYADRLAKIWSRPVVVENRQGAEGISAVHSLMSANDEHTLLVSGISIISMNSVLFDTLPYDPDRDLVPIAATYDNFIGVAAAKSVGGSLRDILSDAQRRPGSMNWAATPGTSTAVMLALVKASAVDAVRVPYRDFTAAFEDLARVGSICSPPASLA